MIIISHEDENMIDGKSCQKQLCLDNDYLFIYFWLIALISWLLLMQPDD